MPVGSIAKALSIATYSPASSGGSSLGYSNRPRVAPYGDSSYSSFGNSGF